ncbi:MAG: protein kinase domain-containing protein [Candidatus Polarisedimenticolia bacterium]
MADRGLLGGLCPLCLLELAETAAEDGARVAVPLPSLDSPRLETPLRAGRILGRRYRLLGTLGRGGAAAVWLAFDLKLQVNVALKVLHPEVQNEEPPLHLLRQEVRSARQVVSPHVCRVFDLVEEEGHEMVSMEYVEGATLADLLAERGPLGLPEAGEIAAQLLAGLEAIHQAGLVHRDFKPENIMITPAGRTVVMDFGLTRSLLAWETSTIAGTPHYMAPEQAEGKPCDARADVFAAGMVLAEMVSPEGAESREAWHRLLQNLRADPPRVPEGPWRPVLLRALARSPGKRFSSAGALARALEKVSLQAARTGERCPYPGLDPFTERDSGHFFGRELEVEALLGRLRRPCLRAVIGPSGAGKSSFLRAGVLPALPPGWTAAVCTPGDRPLSSLAQALAAVTDRDSGTAGPWCFEDSAKALAALKRWRDGHEHALLIVDQFEELFTLNPEDVQARFAEILWLGVLEADIHVLLSLRDDFLFRCQSFEALRPALTELFPLAPLEGQALRRALVQPALAAGYRFDDDRLADDMLEDVAHERGALPLLAFAAARLWESRDREAGLLTRAAYSAIGGVGGALARHGEATLDAIGPARTPIAREIFRNLMTAVGTRAVRNREELLSVFTEPQVAEEVLRRLIDARLLTVFDVGPSEADPAGGQRIEIIHESLLTAWPRLVHWRTQDAEGAQFREQLRKAAHLWDERARPNGLLWTGTSFKEFQVWRNRYPGRLSATEEDFARAMAAHAGRSRRRRRLALASAFVVLVGIVVVVGELWISSRVAERHARLEARRAAAQQLFAIGQVEMRENPSAALAYATASLERDDNRAVREFALQALWHGPTALMPAERTERAEWHLGFSPDGQWLAAGFKPGGVWQQLWPRDGGPYRPLEAGPWLGFTPDSRYLVSTSPTEMRIYRLPDLDEIRHVDDTYAWGFVRGDQLITGSRNKRTKDGWDLGDVRTWSLPQGPPQALGRRVIPGIDRFIGIDPSGRSFLFGAGGDLYEAPVAPGGRNNLRLIGHGDDPIVNFPLVPDDIRVFTWHASGAARVWSRATGASRILPSPPVLGDWRVGAMTHDGRWLACANGNDQTVFLWDLAGPPVAEPLVLRRGKVTAMLGLALDPSGSWLITRDFLGDAFWPLARNYPYVLRGPNDQLRGSLAFDPHGHWVAAGNRFEKKIWIWPLDMEGGGQLRVLDVGVGVTGVGVSPDGRFLVAPTLKGVRLIPLDGGTPRELPGFQWTVQMAAFDRDGHRVAAGGTVAGEAVIRVWDLDSGAIQVLDTGDRKEYLSVDFLAGGRLLAGGFGGLRLWDLTTGRASLLEEGAATGVASPDGRYVLVVRLQPNVRLPVGTAFVHDLQTGRRWDLPAHGNEVAFAAWHPSGALVVTGSRDGVVRVGPVTGEEPHLLMGHEGSVWGVNVDPTGRWIASVGEDRSVRLWPMPEGTPFHTLPYAELLERLRSLTTYRVVEDGTAPTGYRLTNTPFQGWAGQPPGW